MAFDPNIAFQEIPGLTHELIDRRAEPNSHLQANYKRQDPEYPSEELNGKLYGVKYYASALVKTYFQPTGTKKPPTKIHKQEARFTIYSDDVFEGYETHPGQERQRTLFSRSDPEKSAQAKRVFTELTNILGKGDIEQHGWSTTLTIPLTDAENPIKEITTLFQKLEKVEQAYGRGEKPLGDIPIPKWKTKTNPRSKASGEPMVTADPAVVESFDQRAIERAGALKELGKKYFPIATFVTSTQHELFKEELLNNLQITPEQFAAKPELGTADSMHTNVARDLTQQILNAAQKAFPIDASVTKRAQMDFEKTINALYHIDERGRRR